MSKEPKDIAILWPQLSDKKEKAVLIGLQLPKRIKEDIEASLEELKQLTLTAGAEVAHIEITKSISPNPAYYIGSGKASEIAELCKTEELNLVVFDDDLTPAQVKNLQTLFGIKVIDRTELILDIFAIHAHSREGKIQVELAQLQYMLPRLVKAWTHLSRQWGGVGARGPGERQLEVDRRRIRAQITKLKKDLKLVGSHRNLQRKHRERIGIPLVSFIGYTNAGKTSLFNRITKSNLAVENKLFTTLDPKLKNVLLPNSQNVLFSDTVGFINKLPHHLVESFKATLEEVREADLLLHVMDGSVPGLEKRYDVAMNILEELGVINKIVVTVINKIDLIENDSVIGRLSRKFNVNLAISAKNGIGIEDLLNTIQQKLGSLRRRIKIFIPNTEQRLVTRIYNAGHVLKTNYTHEGVEITAELPPQAIGELKDFIVKK